MDATGRHQRLQRWQIIQHEALPDLERDVGVLTPKLTHVIHVLEWVRIEEFIQGSWQAIDRPPDERAWLAKAFVAKAVLGLSSTEGLLERLAVDRASRRICGFTLGKKLPSAATFSRAFAEFAENDLVGRVHETLIKTHLGDELIGHLSRDGTAIVARDRPAKTKHAAGKAAGKEGRKAACGEEPQGGRQGGRPQQAFWGQVQCPGLQNRLEWLQALSQYRRLRRTHRGAAKVMCHLMFRVLVLAADQLMRLQC